MHSDVMGFAARGCFSAFFLFSFLFFFFLKGIPLSGVKFQYFSYMNS